MSKEEEEEEEQEEPISVRQRCAKGEEGTSIGENGEEEECWLEGS